MFEIYMKKRVLVMLASSLIPFGGAILAQSGSIALSSGSATPGGTAGVNLSWTSGGGAQPSALQWTFTYPAASVTNITASAGPALSAGGKTLACFGGSGTYSCIASGLNTSTISDGVVANVSVALATSATNVAIGVNNALGASPTSAVLAVNGTGGVLAGIPASSSAVLNSLSCTPSSLTSQVKATCTVTLSGPAAANTPVAISSSSTLLAATSPAMIAAGASSTSFMVTAGAITTAQNATVTASLSGISKTAAIALQPAQASVTLGALSCSPSSLTSQGSATCTITLSGPAAANTTVAISSSSALLAAPSPATISAGASSATFVVTAGAIAAAQNATVTASLNSVSKTTAIALQPAQASVTLSALSCNPSSLTSQAKATCTVTLSGPAAANTPIAISSSSPLLAVSSATIAAGASSASFMATAGAITTAQNATVTASLSGVSKTAAIALQPTAPVSGTLSALNCSPSSLSSQGKATCTVTLSSGPAAANTPVAVSSSSPLLATSPATIPAGESSASFAVTAGAIIESQNAIVTASLSGVSKTAAIALHPAQASITSIGCDAAVLDSERATSCNVKLSGTVVAGTTITLSSSNPVITIPEGVTAPADATGVTFTATAKAVSSTQSAVMTASVGETSNATAMISVVPAASTGGRLFYLTGEASEPGGTTNGSIVTPITGLTGSLIVAGTGSVNFAPAKVGNGVYFVKGGQQNQNTAFYSFKGTQVGKVFDLASGEISFSMKSRYSFAQRQALPQPNYRWAYDVFDETNRLHSFYLGTSGGRLIFWYQTGSTANQYYFVPVGQEDTLFGSGAVLDVKLTWNGTRNSLYLNGNLVSNESYTKATSSWTANSSFSIGGTDVRLYGGGYYSFDDILDEFQVRDASQATTANSDR